MYIKVSKSKSNNEEYVYLVESYRDLKGNPRQRVIESYGTVSDLIKEDRNALENLKKWALGETLSNKESRYVNLVIDLKKEQSNSQPTLNYGYLFLEAIYNELKISSFIDKYSSDKNFEYDLDDILKLLVFSRCLNPESKKKTYEKKGNYFFELKDFTLDDVYKSLSHLTTLKDELMVHLNDKITNQGLRDVSLVFYDVTNYYFESTNYDGFKERGVSKENRDTGIVQMGLFIDNNGIPITYELFSGNTNDLNTMRPILEKIKRDFNLGKITIVADKGNNSKGNLALIDSYGDNYIISQKIRNGGTFYSNIVLDANGYTYNLDGTFKYKLVELEREVLIDGSIKVLKEHLMCFWSKAEEIYQKNKRGLLDEKIEKYIKVPSLLNASNSFGIKKYFNKIKVDKKTGEVLNGKDKYVFNKDKYERDVALDGYYAIVTNDLELDPLNIINYYRRLSKIEESFKITKTDLEGRPVFVWTKEHIEGHFLTCYLALTIYRLMQLKLDNKYPVHQIKDSLNSANLMKHEKDIAFLSDTDQILKELSGIYNLDINYETMRIEKLKKEFKKFK